MKTEQKSMRDREREREKKKKGGEEEGTSEIYSVSCNVHDSGCWGKKVLFFCFVFFLLV